MKQVLIVEDNMDVAQYICDIFEINGYGVRVAYDGLTGWEEIQHQLPDVVISDVDMPELDGYQLLDRVRHDNGTETLPFILLTARTERDNIRHGMNLGADDYVTKPFSANEILKSVETMIGKQEKYIKKQETTMRLLRKNITHSLPHELRTPLQSIIGYANLMQMDYDSMERDNIKMMADMIFDSGMRLQRLAENMLTYAQIEIIASNPEQQEQLRNNILRDPAQKIEDCINKVATQHKRLDDVTIDLDEQVLRITADNLNRIIHELVDNAFKFSQAGSPVNISATVYDEHYEIVISDYGRGMTAEQINLIGAYMQFDRVLYEQQGMGMGLNIAKRLVELHLGTVSIRSRPDDGTQVIVQIPI